MSHLEGRSETQNEKCTEKFINLKKLICVTTGIHDKNSIYMEFW